MRHRLCEVVTLDHVAAFLGKEVYCGFIFNTFCNSLHVKRFRESESFGNNDPGAGIIFTAAEESGIKLKDVERHILQRVKRRVACSEVIHGDKESVVFKTVDRCYHGILVIEESTLGKLYLNE